jgi:formamidopyrimidine-DNA glycosylase
LAVPPISLLAPDAHDDLPPLQKFAQMCRETTKGQANTRQVKAWLLDQNAVVAGIGNWIADEVLYQARVHPMTPCSVLDSEEVGRLHECVKSVIGHAVGVNADADQFPRDWLFHYRWDKPRVGAKKASAPKMPDGKSIRFVTAGGRTSAYVDGVQVLRTTPRRVSTVEEETHIDIAPAESVKPTESVKDGVDKESKNAKTEKSRKRKAAASGQDGGAAPTSRRRSLRSKQ